MRNRPSYLLVWILLTSLSSPLFANPIEEKKDFEISKNFDILHALFRELDQFYVDSVRPEKTLKNAINGLMSSYDPYTNYMAETETDELKFITTGEYGGVGAIIGQRNGKVIVLEPYGGLAAQKAGLTYGDELLEIGGVKMTGADTERASELLKGQPGTEVKVVFKREGMKKPVEKIIKRELILINQVTWHGLVSDKVGYINLGGFTNKSSQEVQAALMDLKKKGAEKLILDIRGNGGGLLEEAVSVCNLFVPKGREIVSTRGKIHQWDRTYKTTREPVDTMMPLIVMVNSGSASSSEIVAGALQDLDRAVILGTRTFGKGLVQTTRSVPYNGILKITTAKYYIPSGRCIQAIDYAHRNEDGSVGRIPDSLTHEFRTRAGRLVRDGGGIIPDIECLDDRGADITYDLMDSLYFFEFANQYFRKHEKIAPVSEFKLSETDFSDFIAYVKGRGFLYTSSSQKMLDRLKEVLDKDNLTPLVEPELAALRSKLDRDLDAEFQTYRDEIELLLSSEIVSRYYFQAGELEQSLKFDPSLKRSNELFMDMDLYSKTLQKKP
jgi:carboxyl-terminal processing protease